MQRALIIGCLSLLFTSCDYSRVFEKNRDLKNSNWPSDSAVTFDVEMNDNSFPLNLYFNLRNKQSYKYSNLYVLSELQLPSGSIEKDTLEFILADQSGRWLGNSSGAIVTHQILFQRKVLFPDTGTYSFKFSQLMRDKQLDGVTEVGLRLEKAEL